MNELTVTLTKEDIAMVLATLNQMQVPGHMAKAFVQTMVKFEDFAKQFDEE